MSLFVGLAQPRRPKAFVDFPSPLISMAAVCLNVEEKVSRESALINMNQEMEESEENVLVRLYGRYFNLWRLGAHYCVTGSPNVSCKRFADRFQLNAIDQIISHLSFEDLSNASRAFEEWKHIFNDFKVWNKVCTCEWI